MIPFRSPILSSLDGIQLGDRCHLVESSLIQPQMVNWGDGTVDVGVDCTTGSILSVGLVSIHDRVSVSGSIETRATVARGNQTTVSGTVTEHGSVSLPQSPSISVTWPSGSQEGFTVDSANVVWKTAGVYGSVIVHSNAILTLSAGTYFFASLTMDSDSVVKVDGEVVIHVRDALVVRGQFKDAAGNLTQVSLLYHGQSAAVVEREFHGVVLAPNGMLQLGSTVPVRFGGQFLAKQLILRPDVTVVAEVISNGGIFPTPVAPNLVFGVVDGGFFGDGSQLPVDATVVNWGRSTIRWGDGARTGGVASVGDVEVGRRSTIGGPVQTGGKLSLGQDSSATGPVVEGVLPVLPPMPALPDDWPSVHQGSILVLPSETRTLVPGTYDRVEVAAGGTLVLSGSTFQFGSLRTAVAGAIVANPGARIDVRDALTLAGPIRSSDGTGPAAVQVRYFGTAPVEVSASFSGQVVAPKATLVIGSADGTSVFKGQAFAHQIIVTPNTRVEAVSLLGSDLFGSVGGPDSLSKTFSGPAKLVFPPVVAEPPLRISIRGVPGISPIELSRGGTVWVDAAWGATWQLVVEAQGADGTWKAVGTTSTTGRVVDGVRVDSVEVVTGGAKVSVLVQRLESSAPKGVFTLLGTVTWSDGHPFHGTIRAFDKDLFGSQELGSAETDENGSYAIAFIPSQYVAYEHKNADLFIEAVFGSRSWGKSSVFFNSQTPTRIDLVLESASRSEVSEYERLELLIRPLLGGRDLVQEIEAKRISEPEVVEFLKRELDIPEERGRFFVAANRALPKVQPPAEGQFPVTAMALYGLFRQSLPMDLLSLGRHSVEELNQALLASQRDGIIDLGLVSSDPDIVAMDNARILHAQEKARRWGFFRRLFSGRVGAVDSDAFTDLLQTHRRSPTEFWAALAERETSEKDIKTMQLLLAIHQVAGGSLSLAEKLLELLPKGPGGTLPTDLRSLTSIPVSSLELAIRDSKATDPNDPTETPRQKAETLHRIFAQAFPRDALVVLLRQRAEREIDVPDAMALLESNQWLDPRSPLPERPIDWDSIPESRRAKAREDWAALVSHLGMFPYPVPMEGRDPEVQRARLVATILERSNGHNSVLSPLVGDLVAFFEQATDFQFGRAKATAFLEAESSYLSSLPSEKVAAIKTWVRVFSRLYGLKPSVTTTWTLLSLGFKSAAQIARMSKARFESFCQTNGLIESAPVIHKTARKIQRTTTEIHGIVNARRNALPIRALQTDSDPDENPYSDLDWSHVFGRPIASLVPEWRSVLSPASYFVELLRYLGSLVPPTGTSQPLSALLSRRPDLVHVPLGKDSTFGEVSHSRLVLEILQAFVVHSKIWNPTAWASLDWNQIAKKADAALAGEIIQTAEGGSSSRVEYPFQLPVDARKRDQDLYLGLVGTSLADLASSLAVQDSPSNGHAATCARLGLARRQFEILTMENGTEDELARFWGCTVGELETLGRNVSNFIGRAQITYIDLLQYSATRHGGAAFQVNPSATGDFGEYEFAVPLDTASLWSSNRFFRLLKALRRLDPAIGLQDLDAAFAAFGTSDGAAFLQSCAGIVTVAKTMGLGWNGALDLVAGPDRHGILEVGVDGAMERTPSRFEVAFRTTDPGADPDLALESDGELHGRTASLESKSDAIRSLLGLDSEGWSAILAISGIPDHLEGTLTASNLSRLRSIALLASKLGLAPRDLQVVAKLHPIPASGDSDAWLPWIRTWKVLSAAELPWSKIGFLLGGAGSGASGVVPLSDAAQAILDRLGKAYEDTGSDSTDPSTSGGELSGEQVKARTEIVGKLLSEAIGSTPERVLHLAGTHLVFSVDDGSGSAAERSVLACLLHPELVVKGFPEGNFTGIEAFASLLGLLQKAVLFADGLGLDNDDLDAMAGLSPAEAYSWSEFDLNKFAGELEPSSVAWFVAVVRCQALRKQVGTTRSPADPSLPRIWMGVFNAGEIAAATGWDAATIEAIHALRDSGSVADSNSVAFEYLEAIRETTRLGATAGELADWSLFHSDEEPSLEAIRQKVRSRFEAADWTAANRRWSVASLNFRRENLVDLVLRSADLPVEVDSADRLYEWFLIDVAMDASQNTSRLVQAIASIQQFVQRCQMDLESRGSSTVGGFTSVSASAFDPKRWNWLKNYRVWEANRRVLLYPENYLEPELRPDKTELFEELETTLSQAELTAETIERAFETYLRRLDAISNLKLVAHCLDPESGVLHLFGKTADIPSIHYHRMRSKQGVWGGWKRLELDIPSDHLVPVFNNRRLYLYWLEFEEKADQPIEKEELLGVGTSHQGKRPRKHWEISLAWSEFQYGKWSQKTVTSPERGSADQPVRGTTLRTSSTLRDPSEYRLQADPAAALEGALPLRLLEASHRENTISRERMIYDETKVRSGSWWNRKVTYVRTSRIELEIIGTGEYRSHLVENGNWSVSRPGGRLLPRMVDSNPFRIDTDQDWTNDYQSWKMSRNFALTSVTSWAGESGVAASSAWSDKLDVLNRIDNGSVVFDPLDTDTEIHAPWRSFLFFDERKSYLVTPVSPADGGRMSQELPDKAVADVLSFPQTVDPVAAMTVIPDGTETSVWKLYYGEYFSVRNSGGQSQQIQSFKLRFEPHYHPGASRFLSSLVASGVEAALAPESQSWSLGDGAFLSYMPGTVVDPNYPREEVDFSLSGSYSVYNWEVFFHAPLLIASRLVREKRFDEARKWFHLIFDPTASKGGKASSLDRFWKFQPFQSLTSAKLDGMLDLFRATPADDSAKAAKQNLQDQLEYSSNHPFEPHGIARLRLDAYQKSVFMKYVDNLVEWADQLFTAYTRESINEATQLYVLARDLLGPAPERVPVESPESIPTFSSLEERANREGEPLDGVEDWLSDANLSVAVLEWNDQGDADGSLLAEPASDSYFCIPDNEILAGFWPRIEDRLFKIHHGLDIDGNARPLALFSPRLDPSDLVGGAAAGSGSGQNGTSISVPTPNYRFSYMLPKAMEFCNELKSFGSSLLSALEKKDAEQLGLIRSGHELSILAMTRRIRESQLEEAQSNLESSQATRRTVQARRDHYANLKRVSDLENSQIARLDAANALRTKAQQVNTLAAALAAIPTISAGASGFGGSPHIVTEAGGDALRAGSQAIGSALDLAASIQSHLATRAGTLAGWERRAEEWDFQVSSADLELEQIDAQIESAKIRLQIAKSELESLRLQVRNSQEVEAFLKSKFSNQELYSWTASQLSNMYLRAYQLAYQLGKQVESCFTAERRRPPTVGISPMGWNGLRKGLLSGESLSIDLKRLEAEFLSKNARDPEFTKTISLVSIDPLALVQLKATGSCVFSLPESLFDMDHPGCYHRLIKSVSVTVPSVTGPYTGINGRLEYTTGKIRRAPGGDAWKEDDEDRRGGERIVLSHGQNDAGMFETNLRDERYLPFEGRGLVESEWKLTLRQESNSFDVHTVSDVVLRIQYTALWDAAFEADVLKNLSSRIQSAERVRFFSLRHDFADAWQAWNRAGFGKPVELSMSNERFPVSTRGKTIAIKECTAVVVGASTAWTVASASVGGVTSTGRFKSPDGYHGYMIADLDLLNLSAGVLAVGFPGAPSVDPNDILLVLRYTAG